MPTTRGVALPEKLGVLRRNEVKEYLSPVRAMTRRSRFSLATRGLVSFLYPDRSAIHSAASVALGTPRRRGAGLALNLYLPANGPLRVQWGGAATP